MDQKAKATPQLKEEIHKIRITLTSTDHKSLEKATTDLVREARGKNLRVKGPVRLPTRILRITTRKTPCGQGTNSWHRYQMRVHKRLIDLHSPSSVVSDITSIMQPGVEIELSVEQ
eukprot:CAMPEP_0117437594 /NCGR_PEP_ID=MMETSP0759-20121206/1605_1 /TAXON_ID=63605 /ORGANISM="Percolomonas cosmopolitus, Strain WS" /LENGTH=115 /DNA_ID=CAMNT_0005229233 /DNA_START=56 /DNA_END=403 /DNA_ORIENTATION=-